MRLRNVRGARERIAAAKYTVKEPEKNKGKWNEFFAGGIFIGDEESVGGGNLIPDKTAVQNERPLHIEIGMGKGRFIMELAKKNPDINYVGIEKYSSVLIRALEKMEERQLPNLVFVRMDAEDIEDVFEKGEVSQIYLNFSDPWPKDRHAKRRLTSTRFLTCYESILKKDGKVIFKTDNRELFDFSLEQVEEAGWVLESCTYDLHNSEYNEGNVMTEYEERFSKEGKPINRMVIHQKQ